MNLEGDRVYLRLLQESDASDVLDLMIRNKDFLQKYSPLRSDDFYTLESQRERIRNSISGSQNDREYSFGIFIRNDGSLVGNVTLRDIVRGSLQSCELGYYLDKQHNGRGYMTEAVGLAVKFAFQDLHLHRIEAGVNPENTGSLRVLEKAGFHCEGTARKNVKINGIWTDHQVFALISVNTD